MKNVKKKKIEDCKKNNLNLIQLTAEDAKKDLNKVFSFLFKNEDLNSISSAS